MVTSQSSRVSSSIGRAMSTPALFTSTSISPRAADDLLDERGDLLGIGHVRRRARGLDAGAAQLVQQRGDLRTRAGADADPVAGAAEGERGGAADALGRTGDERGA